MLWSMSKQSKEACSKLQNHFVFGQEDFNILALSQGALIGRHVIEACDLRVKVRNFITVGSPNNGIFF
jgi:hypothetical protein